MNEEGWYENKIIVNLIILMFNVLWHLQFRIQKEKKMGNEATLHATISSIHCSNDINLTKMLQISVDVLIIKLKECGSVVAYMCSVETCII